MHTRVKRKELSFARAGNKHQIRNPAVVARLMAAQQRARRKKMRLRPSLAPYADDVEVTERLVAWPRSKEDQVATLASIPPQAWTMIPEYKLGAWFWGGGHWLLADYVIDTQYGRRRFNVWKPPKLDDRVIVIKQMNPAVLVITCALRLVGGKLEASFLLLSGHTFAKQSFEANLQDQVLYFYQLRYRARDFALEQGLLESRGHSSKLLLAGFAGELPDFTPVYRMSERALTMQNLEARLSYLQGLAPIELEELAEKAAEEFGRDQMHEV